MLRPVVFLIEKEGLCQHPLLANCHYNPFKTWEHDGIFKLLLKQEGDWLQWNAKLFVETVLLCMLHRWQELLKSSSQWLGISVTVNIAIFQYYLFASFFFFLKSRCTEHCLWHFTIIFVPIENGIKIYTYLKNIDEIYKKTLII